MTENENEAMITNLNYKIENLCAYRNEILKVFLFNTAKPYETKSLPILSSKSSLLCQIPNPTKYDIQINGTSSKAY